MSSVRPERDVESILQARARALAQPEVEEARDTEALATFNIGGHVLGVPIDRVVRASDLRHITEVPDAPAYLLGLTAVEGFLVSLLDLAEFLGLGRRGVADVRGILVVAGAGREIGLAAEQLLGIVDVPGSETTPLEVTPALPRVARRRGPHGSDLMIIDVDELLADSRLGKERG